MTAVWRKDRPHGPRRTPDRDINVPLEATYQAAFHGLPSFWRDVLEGRQPKPPTEWQ